MSRVILHCDGNSFFASVECALHPELASLPLAVCGDPQQRRGIVLAKNELAKRYGITTGQTVWEAKRRCPQLQLVQPHHNEYHRFCVALNEIYLSYTDLVEPFSVDESWLDVTGSRRLFGDGKQIADEIRARVKKELGITVSVGVSFNKVFAKLGSDYRKPDATTVIGLEDYQTILYPLPVERMLFVGKQTKTALAKLQIFTIGDLAHSSRSLLSARLGKIGEQLWDYANGRDDAPVLPFGQQTDAKSVGKGMTYPKDLTTEPEIHAALQALCEQIGAKLRREGYRCSCVALSIKDANLKTVRRQMQLSLSTDSTHTLTEGAMLLYRSLWKAGQPVRALTVTAEGLLRKKEQMEQLSFWAPTEGNDEKFSKAERAVDRIRTRFGKDAVSAGALLPSVIQGEEIPKEIKGGDPK